MSCRCGALARGRFWIVRKDGYGCMDLVDLFSESRLIMDLKARDKRGAIRELVQCLVDGGAGTEETARKIEKAVNKREADGSTGIGKGLAIPHAKDCSFLSEMVAVFGRSREGIQFNAVDGGLVYLVFLVASPDDHTAEHLGVMRKIAALHRDEKTLKFLKTTDDYSAVIDILKEMDEGS